MFLRTKSLSTKNPAPSLFYLSPLPFPKVSKPEPEVTHHIFVIDRSGSMFGDMDSLKSSIEQVLAVETLLNPNVLTTLISFSSHGDVTLHWSRVAASEITVLSGPYLPILRSIRATYLTGISQGLNLALTQVNPGQTTGITLFTDGYANDPSTAQENIALDTFVQEVKDNHPAVFVNCIGYRDWCDWNRLGSIANTLSGKCVKARSFADVLSALRDTQALLSGYVEPPIEFPAGHEQQYILAVNKTTGQVNMSKAGEKLIYRGASVDDAIEVYKVTAVAATPRADRGHTAIPAANMSLAGALSLGFLYLNDIRTAKEILFSSGNKTLWNNHQASITPSMLAGMASNLRAWVQSGNNAAFVMGRNVLPKHNLFDLVQAVSSLPNNSLAINTTEFRKIYRRRSIQRVIGTRQEDGTLIPPNTFLRPLPMSPCFVRSMEFNVSEATLQLNTVRVCDLQDANGQSVLPSIPYAPQLIHDYSSFTLLSSGEWNVKWINVILYKKQAYTALRPFMRSKVGPYKSAMEVSINLTQFRAEASADSDFAEKLGDIISARNRALVDAKLLSAMQSKEETETFSAEQVAELRKYHLTPNLYYSPPTTTHYTNWEQAVREGKVDSYTRYRVHFGTLSILDTDDFRSGNAFLDRRYIVTLNGEQVKGPKLTSYLQGATYTLKPPGRGKDTAADNQMARVADFILLTGHRLPEREIEACLDDAKVRQIAANALLRPLVVEIGCTGLLPSFLESQAKRFTADKFAEQYNVKLGKNQKEGVFFVLPNNLTPDDPVVISVVPENAWYTVHADSDLSADGV